MASPASVVIHAPAKINLDLRVVGTHADGYHEIRTIFQSLELHDTLILRARAGPFALRCRVPGIPLGAGNLVWRAAAELWTAMGRVGDPTGVAVVLTKRIPAAAGLGGGSSDAAAALVGLSRLWGTGLSQDELREIGVRLGADVPYFFDGGTVLGLGRGDELFALREPAPRWVVLVVPDSRVSTADAYGWYDADRSGKAARSGQGARRWPARESLANDLEGPVVRRVPSIGRARDSLAATGAELAAMSGSGSAVFALYAEAGRAASAVRAVRRQGVCALVTRTSGRGMFARMTRPVVVTKLRRRRRGC